MARPRQEPRDTGPGTNAGVGWRAEGWKIEFRDGWDRHRPRGRPRDDDHEPNLLQDIEEFFG